MNRLLLNFAARKRSSSRAKKQSGSIPIEICTARGDFMKLSEASLEWALTHLQRENDTDLFPEPIEIEIVNQQRAEIVKLLKDVDLGCIFLASIAAFHGTKGRIVIPDDYAARSAGQHNVVRHHI